VLTAAGRPQLSLLLVAILVGIQAGLGALLTPAFRGVGIATATAAAMATGVVGAQLALRRLFGAGLDLGVALRVLAAAVPAAAIPHFLLGSPTLLGGAGFLAAAGGGGIASKLVTVIVFGVAVAAFVALLFVTGGLGRQDADRFRRVFARGRQGAQGT
jgi:hypothetical protein